MKTKALLFRNVLVYLLCISIYLTSSILNQLLIKNKVFIRSHCFSYKCRVIDTKKVDSENVAEDSNVKDNIENIVVDSNVNNNESLQNSTVSVDDTESFAQISERNQNIEKAEEEANTFEKDSKAIKEAAVAKAQAAAKAQAEAQKNEEAKKSAKEKKEQLNEDEVMLLAKLIYGEARGCSDETQKLVGMVVINRMKNPKFPDTMRNVIYEEGQYATADQLNSYHPTEKEINNAREVLSGKYSCPSNVVFQAGFKQGSGVYMCIDGQYFCYL